MTHKSEIVTLLVAANQLLRGIIRQREGIGFPGFLRLIQFVFTQFQLSVPPEISVIIEVAAAILAGGPSMLSMVFNTSV